MSEISVVIVSWNARSYLRDCLTSIREHGASLVREVIVVDNASTDGSPEMVAKEFPDVLLIQSAENLGFARGNNLGLRHSTGSLLALINSDVIIHPECFQRLLAALESRRDVGLVAPKIRGGNGLLQRTCGQFPTLWNTTCRFLALDRAFGRWPLFSGFQMRNWDYANRAEVEVLSGCFWLARRSAVDQVGGLDDRFFFYAEDIDWCKRFKDAGWKLLFVPEASATHFGGASSSNAPLRYSIEILRSSLLYWRKHHGSVGRFMYYLIALSRYSGRLLVNGALSVIPYPDREESRHKLKEDIVCLRWLVTGKSV